MHLKLTESDMAGIRARAAEADKSLLSMEGKGYELQQLLRRELGIPEGVVSFSVHFKPHDAVRVECEYIPRDKD